MPNSSENTELKTRKDNEHTYNKKGRISRKLFTMGLSSAVTLVLMLSFLFLKAVDFVFFIVLFAEIWISLKLIKKLSYLSKKGTTGISNNIEISYGWMISIFFPVALFAIVMYLLDGARRKSGQAFRLFITLHILWFISFLVLNNIPSSALDTTLVVVLAISYFFLILLPLISYFLVIGTSQSPTNNGDSEKQEMERFVENDVANRQILKIRTFIKQGLSDEEIARKFETDGEKNLKNYQRSWSEEDIGEIRVGVLKSLNDSLSTPKKYEQLPSEKNEDYSGGSEAKESTVHQSSIPRSGTLQSEGSSSISKKYEKLPSEKNEDYSKISETKESADYQSSKPPITKFKTFWIIGIVIFCLVIFISYQVNIKKALLNSEVTSSSSSSKSSKKSAELGNAIAQFNMANKYYQGTGVEQNYKEAVKWYKKSANQGHATAQFNLAAMYCYGEGILKDLKKCSHWAQEAEKNGYNVKKLWKWFELWKYKTEKSLRPARSSKGKYIVTVFYKKKGNKRLIRLKTSPTESYKTVNEEELHKKLAALQKKHNQGLYVKITIPDNSGLTYNEAWLFTSSLQKYDYFSSIPFQAETYNKISEEDLNDIAKNYKELTEEYKDVSSIEKEENVDAKFTLGNMLYLRGDDDKQDSSQAVKMYRKAADQGDAEAQYNLGVMYSNGDGVKQDTIQAFKWWRKAAEQGYVDAQYNLGVMYDKGESVKQDYSQAFKWSSKAAEQGVADAQFNLGVMYYKEKGVKQDLSKALKWFRKAAEQGDADAQFNLGVMYFKGIGVNKSRRQAVKWWRKAAEQGHADAKTNLGRM